MSKATTDPDTPIFGELYGELELPEIDVHDFEAHDFGFPTMPSTNDDVDTAGVLDPGETGDTGSTESNEASSTAESAHSQEEATEKTPVATAGKRGGRRRKAE